MYWYLPKKEESCWISGLLQPASLCLALTSTPTHLAIPNKIPICVLSCFTLLQSVILHSDPLQSIFGHLRTNSCSPSTIVAQTSIPEFTLPYWTSILLPLGISFSLLYFVMFHLAFCSMCSLTYDLIILCYNSLPLYTYPLHSLSLFSTCSFIVFRFLATCFSISLLELWTSS